MLRLGWARGRAVRLELNGEIAARKLHILEIMILAELPLGEIRLGKIPNISME